MPPAGSSSRTPSNIVSGPGMNENTNSALRDARFGRTVMLGCASMALISVANSIVPPTGSE